MFLDAQKLRVRQLFVWILVAQNVENPEGTVHTISNLVVLMPSHLRQQINLMMKKHYLSQKISPETATCRDPGQQVANCC